MDVFVVDDSKQDKPTRQGMRALVAVGGLHVPGDRVRELERKLDSICERVGFPLGEEFKWSPDKKTWMHKHLHGGDRQRFLSQVLAAAVDASATGIVVIADKKAARAVPEAKDSEEDVVTLFLERADNHLVPSSGEAIVVCDRPSGGRKAEEKFLSRCLDRIRTGTAFVRMDRLALLLTTDSRLARLVQLADVVTGCTLAYVAGQERYAARTFDSVKPLLREEGGRIGGVGLKLHPDFRYGNLYHWLLGDTHLWRYNVGVPLPIQGRPYAKAASEF